MPLYLTLPFQIYTGDETKVRVKQQTSRVKVASVEAVVNGIVLRIVFVLLAVCLLGALCSVGFVTRAVHKHDYLGFTASVDAGVFFQVWDARILFSSGGVVSPYPPLPLPSLPPVDHSPPSLRSP